MKQKTTKQTHRLRNWNEYNAALVKRGSLSVWVDEAVLSEWTNAESRGKRGAPRLYSELAIECMAMLKAVYHLPLRATEGFLASILDLLGVDLPVPDYTTLSRRQRTLEVCLPKAAKAGALHMVVDATGVKIYGEGEWKVRQHGASKRRTWRKLHLGVDEATGEIVAAALSTNDFGDGELLPDLLDQVDEALEQVSGDGAYDSRRCYRAIGEREARAAIPPRRGARIEQHGNCAEPALARDENLRAIRRHGRSKWKRESGYHRRSLAETAMFRIKTIFGAWLSARLFETQSAEMSIECAALNRMTQLGMPDSYAA
jgi:hypothetical protein